MATPKHDVGTFIFDKGSYAEFDFALYDYDGTTRFAVTATDRGYLRLGTNGAAATLEVSETASNGSVVTLDGGATGNLNVKISTTDSAALTATTYDFQVFVFDDTDNETKYFCRGKFKVEATVNA